MIERGISKPEILEVLNGEMIESYPNDSPYPSRLMMALINHRPLHVVAADIPETGETVIITVYEPDLRRWDVTFRLRRRL
jgi:hypothetical protein